MIRSRYNYDREELSLKTGENNIDKETGELLPTRTQQHFKEESDINVLVKRFAITGELPQGVRMPTYEDFTETYDFHSAANAIAQAREAFMHLPADLRYNRFQNDPGAFVAFCSNEANRDEAEKLGLVPKREPINTAPTAPIAKTPAVGAGDNTGSAGGTAQ